MPSKPRSAGKEAPKITKLSESSTANPQTASGLDPEVENRFEVELCWCIQQLETCLGSNKYSEKQAQSMAKTIHVLKSDSASLIKKRQLMRNNLGDYRKKMTEEEKKFGKTVLKFTPTKATNNFVFIKKANVSQDNKSILDVKTSDEPFKFNFKRSDE